LEAWKLGSLEAWKLGSLEAWKLGSLEAIVASHAGQGWVTGYNTIFLVGRDPFVKGFTVS